MARSGTHQGQAASVLDQILPAVVAGRLIVWTEATPTGTARLLQLRPTLRSLFEVVRLEPQSPEETPDARHEPGSRRLVGRGASCEIDAGLRAGRAQLARGSI